MSVNEPEPPPVPNNAKPIWELVIDDMRDRDRIGREKYGTPLQANNGRCPLTDAYQESLDQSAYLRQAIVEAAALRSELAAVRADLAEAVAALNRTSEALSQANGDDRLEKIHGEIIAANDAIIAKHTKGIS